jgi:hygromycin-B 7''-O-kinase
VTALLPEVKTFADYRRIYRDEGVWLPAMRAICERHGLDVRQLAFAPPGTHVVFCAGPDLYLKLFSPLWGADYAAERAVLRALADRPDLLVPHLVAEGQIEGWPYLVLTAVRGVPLGQVWGRMGARDRVQVVQDCGRFLAALHATPTEGLGEIATDWPRFVQARREACLEQVREADLGSRWLDAVRAFLDGLPPLYEPGFRPVLLCADVTDEHVLVGERAGRWAFTGYIDFGDAMLGHPLYEFAAPGCCLTRGLPELQRALLCAYGFEEGELTQTLSDRLMAYTLLHRYIRISDLLGMFGPAVPADLDELQRMLWLFERVDIPYDC